MGWRVWMIFLMLTPIAEDIQQTIEQVTY